MAGGTWGFVMGMEYVLEQVQLWHERRSLRLAKQQQQQQQEHQEQLSEDEDEGMDEDESPSIDLSAAVEDDTMQ